MRIFWIHLLLLVVASSGRNVPTGPSLSGDLYPANMSRTEFKSKCPQHSDKIDYCYPDYKICAAKLSSPTACEHQFCSCVKISDTENSEPAECFDHDACLTIRKNEKKYREQIIEDMRNLNTEEIIKELKPLFDAQNRMVKDCEIESKLKVEEVKLRLAAVNRLLNLTMPFFALNNIELPKTEKCESARLYYLEKYEEVDGKTSRTLKIPYNMWFIGAEFGPMGRVITRIIADQTCDKSSSELNHHSVTRVNCYDQQQGKDECDEEFFKSVNHTLSTLDGKKVKCKMFVEFLKGLQQLRSDVFYKEASEYHVDASKVSLNERMLTEGFKAYNQSLTQRDTKTTIVSFESTERFPALLQQYFDRVSSECSNSRNSADIVASCGFRYGQCILQNALSRKKCGRQLDICLRNIPDMRKSCEEAYQTVSEHLWPSTPPTQKTEEVSEIESSFTSWSFWEIVILICCLALGAVLLCGLVMWASSCWKHPEQIFSENEDHSTTIEKQTLLHSALISETSSSGSGTSTPSSSSDRTPPNAPDSNDMDVPDSVSIQSDANNDNVPVIPKAEENNQPEKPSPMKTEIDSVFSEPVNIHPV